MTPSEPEKAATEKPAAEKPIAEKPATEKPAVAEEPAAAEKVAEKPAADQPAAGKPLTEEKTAGTTDDKKDAESKDAAAKDDPGKEPTGKDATGKDATGTDVSGKDAPARDGDTKVAAAVPPLTPVSKTPGGKNRRIRPLAAAGTAGRATATWARGPVGRVILPGVVVVGLMVAAATSGAYLVPRALEAGAPTATPTFTDQSGAPAPGVSDPAAPGAPGGTPPVGGVPGGTLPATGFPTAQPTATGARPADALASWAQQVGTRVGIPVVAVQAYGYAELVTARTTPSCHLSWTTLAAIGKVESGHGSHEGAVLGVDGMTQPSIRGLPLDGQGGRQLIRDTDRGLIDGDTAFDRAVGPMQFIPATWQAAAIDADNNGVKDPNDIDDAAMTAAAYLCQGGRDMARADSWWEAVLTYNDVRQYAQDVFTAANDYGLRSRT